MKCPNCGREIGNDSKFCNFCGTQITGNMPGEQEQVNNPGRPEYGSSNVEFQHEEPVNN